MKQYVIDGLTPGDHEKLHAYFQNHLEPAGIDGIYWVEITGDLLTDLQRAHEGCRPHVFALMLEPGYLSCELLVRIKKSVRCDCMGYATPGQREWLVETVDSILDSLGITV